MNKTFYDDEIAERLLRERPVPRAAYRGSLGRHLLSLRRAGFGKPSRLRLLIAVYASSGTALLAVAAVGVLGVGPLAAG